MEQLDIAFGVCEVALIPVVLTTWKFIELEGDHLRGALSCSDVTAPFQIILGVVVPVSWQNLETTESQPHIALSF